MTVKRAKTIEDADVQLALDHVARSSKFPARDSLFILLTHKLGLRAHEVAHAHFEDILDARSAVKDDIYFVSSRAAKYGSARSISMRSDVRQALRAYIVSPECPRLEDGSTPHRGRLFCNQFGEPLSSDAVQKQLRRIYEGIGLKGCSSHSGRRSFGTRMARRAAEYGAGIKEVAHLMGHRSVDTTVIYIESTPLLDAMVRA